MQELAEPSLMFALQKDRGPNVSGVCAVVFQLHYNELLAKDEEITKLRAVIQGLSGR